MSIVRMTVKQCRDLGLWYNYCEWSGCNPYAINEGQIDNDDEIEFDSEFKKEEKQEDKKLTYMIITYDMNMENEDTDYLYTTKENYSDDIMKRLNYICTIGGRLISMIRLETEIDE